MNTKIKENSLLIEREDTIMKKVIAVMSGKGGVGKSSFCAHLGRALSQLGKKVLIVELDSGMRGLDIMLSIEDIVFDLGDILEGRCTLNDAIIKCESEDNLFLISAPAYFNSYPTKEHLKVLATVFLKRYDYVIFDVTAGYSMIKESASVSDEVILITTPDEICIRDTAFYANYIKENVDDKKDIYLVVNKVDKAGFKKKVYKDIDSIMDKTGLALRGVIKRSDKLSHKTLKGLPLDKKTKESEIFLSIAKRIDGIDANLILRELK